MRPLASPKLTGSPHARNARSHPCRNLAIAVETRCPVAVLPLSRFLHSVAPAAQRVDLTRAPICARPKATPSGLSGRTFSSTPRRPALAALAVLLATRRLQRLVLHTRLIFRANRCQGRLAFPATGSPDFALGGGIAGHGVARLAAEGARESGHVLQRRVGAEARERMRDRR